MVLVVAYESSKLEGSVQVRLVAHGVFMPYKDKNKQKEYSRIWTANQRKKFFKDKFCELCGSTKKLELHHKNPEEKENHRIWNWAEERRKEEITKCVVWCRNCHTEYHAKEKRMPIIHGTAAAYHNKNCRCDICREWKANYDKKYRLKKKMGY